MPNPDPAAGEIHVDGERLAGTTVIVTGAGDAADGPISIGGAIARLLALQGADVVVLDVSSDAAERTSSAIAAAGGSATTFVGDVRSRADCEAVVALADERSGRFAGLVNNAAVLPDFRPGGTDVDDWHRVVDTNLLGPTLLSEAAASAMARGGGGSIVNISSISSIRGMGGGAYTSAKGGLNSLTIEHAYLWGRQGIRVNAILPGHVFAPMGDHPTEIRELRRKAGMLGTEGTPWDIAWTVAFLVSDESRWISAVVMPVDAGSTATTAMPMHGHMLAD